MQTDKILKSADKFHIELGLHRISRALEILGNPEKDLKFVHIAGSNGKGSVCAILEEIFVTAGIKTGKFTSPHLFSYTERFCIDKEPISEEELDKIIKRILEVEKTHNISLTEFEILTVAAFLYFKEQGCDIVILETGLGGRLDSTNVIKKPLISVITSISLEHTEILGNTIEEIAKEKAGIIKPGAPVVFLESNKGSKTLFDEAKSKDALVHTVQAFEVEEINEISYAAINFENNKEAMVFGLRGKHQGENLGLALKVVEILNASGALNKRIDFGCIKKALSQVRWKFRLDLRSINGAKVLIDSCHNPDGARVLRKYLDTNFKDKKIRFVFGCLKNKDYRNVFRYLMADNTAARVLNSSSPYGPLKPAYHNDMQCTLQNDHGCFNDGDKGLENQNLQNVALDKNFEQFKLSGQKELFFYEFNYPNALKYEEFLDGILPMIGSSDGSLHNEFLHSTNNPLDEISNNVDLNVITGSIYMLGEIFKEF